MGGVLGFVEVLVLVLRFFLLVGLFDVVESLFFGGGVGLGKFFLLRLG